MITFKTLQKSFFEVIYLDNIVLEYRDPLFGILFLATLVFVISFITYSYGIFKEKKARKDYRDLYLRFELGKLKEEDYVHLYKTYNLPFDSIMLLATSFLHKGDYNKAISVYLALLEHVNDRVKKEELLEKLGTTYFKGGFLQRSKDIFLKILKFSPRNKNALKYLLLISEKLKDYKRAKEIVLCLDELDENVQTDKIYLDSLIIIHDANLSIEKKTELLYDIFKQNNIIERILVAFLIQNNKPFFWEHITEFNCTKFIDVMWYLRKEDIDFEMATKNKFLVELYNAKGYLNTQSHCDDFYLDILILINKHEHSINASLDFEFVCKVCKHSHPMFDTRCPHCHSILSFNVKHQLTKSFYEENQSLQ